MFSKNKNTLKKQTAAVLAVLIVFFGVSYPKKTHAALWPAVDPIMSRMLDTVYDTVMGMIMGALKQSSIIMLNNQVDRMMAGNGTGQAAFITSWDDYLVTQPRDNTKLYMNSYITKMTAGRGSSTGYTSEGFSGTGGYANNLSQVANDNLNRKDTVPTMTYQGDPSQMFAGGNFKNMELYLSGVNNPWAFNMAADSAYQQRLDEEQRIQETQAIAYQGFNPTTTGTGLNRTITSPGIITKEIVANEKNLPNNVLASAKSVPEVISSVVSQMITQSIQQGFSSIQRSAQSNISSQNKLNSGVNTSISSNGPSILYNNTSGSSISSLLNH